MDQDNIAESHDLAALTADVVSAYVSKNSLVAAALPELIATVHASFLRLGQPAMPEKVRPEPRMPIKKTVTPDAIISLEDGKPYKTLKRHLTGRGLTPQQYREKWGLPADYPMTAASYATRRSELARATGLGQKRAAAAKAKPAKVGHTKVA